MTFTLTNTNDSRQEVADLVAKQAIVTALTSSAATAGFQQAQEAQSLNQAQIELVQGAINLGKLNAATIISSCSINVLVDPVAGPQIAAINTLISANPLIYASLSAQLYALQVQVVHTAMVSGGKYGCSAAKILSTMTGGN